MDFGVNGYRGWLLAIACLLTSSIGFGDVFYVDPETGSPEGDGSFSAPWRTLQEVVEAGLFETRVLASHPYVEGGDLKLKNEGAPISAGDTVYLRTGYHGTFSITGGYNETPISIVAEEGHVPRLRNIFLRGASNWIFRGLSISVSHAPDYSKSTLVDIENHGWHGHCEDITVEDCELFSVEDISEWSAQDWLDYSVSAIASDGKRCRFIGNRIKNIRFGISASGDESFVSRNSISNFGGDGMRGLGDHSTFEYNLVENAFKIDENHDDGFQSWSVGEDGKVGIGEVRGMTLRGNVFINTRDLDQPLRTSFQGIGCFDGMFVDWVVENNIVCVNHWHGITLMGAQNCVIRNNTVVDLYEGQPGPSWIRVVAHKNGTPASGNVVSNNLANSFSIEEGSSEILSNLSVDDPDAYFVDAKNYDFRLIPGSPAIGAGWADHSSSIDQKERLRDASPDVGALEFAGRVQANSLRFERTRDALKVFWRMTELEEGNGYLVRELGEDGQWHAAPHPIEADGWERSMTLGLEGVGHSFFVSLGE